MSSKLHTSRLGFRDSWSAPGAIRPPRVCLFPALGVASTSRVLASLQSDTLFFTVLAGIFVSLIPQLHSNSSAIERQIRVGFVPYGVYKSLVTLGGGLFLCISRPLVPPALGTFPPGVPDSRC